MTQDEQHLNLLSMFHYIVGGLTAFFSCMFLLHIAMGIAMPCGAFEGENQPPRILALFFILFPGVFMLDLGRGHYCNRTKTEAPGFLYILPCRCRL